jgi:hypothetical protein
MEGEMSGIKGTLVFALIIYAGLIAFAFHAGDNVYLWGKEAYSMVGAIVICILLVAPFLANPELKVWLRILFSLALGFLGVLVWALGIFTGGLFGPIRVM